MPVLAFEQIVTLPADVATKPGKLIPAGLSDKNEFCGIDTIANIGVLGDFFSEVRPSKSTSTTTRYPASEGLRLSELLRFGEVIDVESRTEMRISQHVGLTLRPPAVKSRGSLFAVHRKRQWVPTTWRECERLFREAVDKNVAVVSQRFNALAFSTRRKRLIFLYARHDSNVRPPA